MFIVTGLMDLGTETLKNKEWTEFSWRKNVYNAEFSVETRLEHGIAIESRISNDYDCLLTIVAITAYKVF